MRDQALALAAQGFSVFPLQAGGKRPAIDDWLARASADASRVAAMWTDPVSQEGQHWNPGIATGQGLVVLDVDDKDGRAGSASLGFLEDLHGDLPRTLTVKTPNGRHLYLHAPPGAYVPNNSNTRLGIGIDVRGDGGYVVGPGSNVIDIEHGRIGQYTCESLAGPVASPAWLFARVGGARPETRSAGSVVGELDQPENVRRATEWLQQHSPPHGSYAVACRVLDYGIATETAAELMVEHWNPRRDQPRDLDHFLVRAENAERFRQNAIGSATADEFEDVSGDVAAANEEGDGLLDWGEPDDLWADMGALPDLAQGILPVVLEAWCRDEARRKGVALGAVALPALVVFAAALSARFEIQVKQRDDQHTERAILWGTLIGGPGARKTPVLREVMKPIKAAEKIWRSQYASEMAAYEARVSAFKRARDTGALEPRKPVERTKLIMDVTAESVVMLEAENPNGLLLFMDELAGWAGSMDSYRGGRAPVGRDGPFWLQAKNGDPYRVRRVSRDAASADVHAVHILGGIQPDVIRKLAPEWGGNGMLQRFLFVHLENAAKVPDLEADGQIRSMVDSAIARILALEPNDFNDHFQFEPAADAFRERINDVAASGLGSHVPLPLQSWFSKLEGEWARIALTLHVAEWATGPGCLLDDFPPDVVSSQTAERAFRFLVEFQVPQQSRFYRGTVGLQQAVRTAAHAVAGHILAHRVEKIADRDLQQTFRHLSGADKVAQRVSIMHELDLAGWVRMTASRHDRPYKWVVNPAVHDGRFAARAETKLASRQASQAKIKAAGAARRAGA